MREVIITTVTGHPGRKGNTASANPVTIVYTAAGDFVTTPDAAAGYEAQNTRPGDEVHLTLSTRRTVDILTITQEAPRP